MSTRDPTAWSIARGAKRNRGPDSRGNPKKDPELRKKHLSIDKKSGSGGITCYFMNMNTRNQKE